MLNRPLTPQEQRLSDALMSAHFKSGFRSNISSNAVVNAAQGSGNFVSSIISALGTLGGSHAPLVETYDFILNPSADDVMFRLESGGRVPGWGNSFHKGHPDQLWTEVDELLKEFPIYEHIQLITEALHRNSKNVYPNPSCYTAACAIVFEIPREAASFLFVQGRLTAWVNLFLQSREAQKMSEQHKT